MKTQTIVLPKSNEEIITSTLVENLLSNRGVVLVFEDENCVGSVVKLDENDYMLMTTNISESFGSLSELMSEYTQFTYKYVTK